MTRYREVWIVDLIHDLNALINLCTIGHIQCSDKDAIITALTGFIQPRLNEICERLKEDEVKEPILKKCGKKTR